MLGCLRIFGCLRISGPRTAKSMLCAMLCCKIPQVRSDVAALAIEEVAPLAVSDAAMRTPAEVYAAQAHGQGKAEAELTQ